MSILAADLRTGPALSSSNIYLIGPMGVGKTTVGKKLAELIGFEFIDTDQELERRTGVTVGHIFEVEGEQGFRIRETRLVEEIGASQGHVVATGGGAVLSSENRRCMKASGQVVYLRAPFEILWNRLKRSTTRPLLQNDDPRGTLEGILRERDPVYHRAADHVVEVSSTSEKTALRLAEWLDHQDREST
ncbi:MAG: shikimate kinase [Gammaproteobacteria bacterium]|nr:shikimate kinase [Gammaproteobacteria bacterium]MYD77023.1 shikimate kinase [Gammaproteobacteria bacterium]MYJ53049.1 shikimate kinase [Gammaproteobacteria bacterium]